MELLWFAVGWRLYSLLGGGLGAEPDIDLFAGGSGIVFLYFISGLRADLKSKQILLYMNYLGGSQIYM